MAFRLNLSKCSICESNEEKTSQAKQKTLARNVNVDVLKAVAIVAVVLYHLGSGILPFGYLGVDIFFVISGYFIMRSMQSEYLEGEKHRYFYTLFSRIRRLWLPILVACAVSLAVGFFTMLPDDFENLSQSVVASSVFANNVLACITTKNYWDVVNTFKPLMHLWYAGVLMQAYVVLPALLMLVFRFCKTTKQQAIAIIGLLVAAFLLYSCSDATSAEKFYYLPYRLFEFLTGALAAIIVNSAFKINETISNILQSLCGAILIVLLCVRNTIGTAQLMLISTVVSTGVLMVLFGKGKQWNGSFVRCFASIGRSSFSIYLWHQVLVAFLYYSLTQKMTLLWAFAFVFAVLVTAWLSYNLLEKPLQNKTVKTHRTVWCVSGVLCVLLCAVGLLGYVRGGVVRDVPELGITVKDAQRGIHAAYNDRVRSWNRDFEDDDRVKVLVLGDSFGRDFANILSESSVANKLQISYIFPTSSGEEMEDYADRISSADVVFYGPSGGFNTLPEWLTNHTSEELIYVVGTKNFGTSNGYVYSHRFTKDYYQMDVNVDKSFWERNAKQKTQYVDQYIDMLEPVSTKNSCVRVFTDDGKFISQDCRHLTRFGAIYYASILDLSWVADMG